MTITNLYGRTMSDNAAHETRQALIGQAREILRQVQTLTYDYSERECIDGRDARHNDPGFAAIGETNVTLFVLARELDGDPVT